MEKSLIFITVSVRGLSRESSKEYLKDIESRLPKIENITYCVLPEGDPGSIEIKSTLNYVEDAKIS